MLVWNYSKSSSIPKSLQKMHTDTYFAFYKLGESNSNWNQNKYQCAFPAMISEWRKIWNSFSPTSDSFSFGLCNFLLALIVESCMKPNWKESDVVWNYSKSSPIPKSLQEMHTDTYFDSNLYFIFCKLGKSNSNWNQNKYQCAFPSMISEWRKIWNTFTPTSDSFPFGFMQLSTIDASNQTGRNLMLMWNYSKSSSIPKS